MGKSTPSTLRAHLIETLREAILSGKYKPGEHLNESSIAREFGISRIPVREALFELRESGLVVSIERRGMFVTSLSDEEVSRLGRVRTVLETEALVLARAHMTPRIASELRTLVDRMESVRSSLADAALLDLEFHRLIWAATGNEYFQRLLDPIATLLFAQYTLERLNSDRRRWRLDQHRALLEALLDPKPRDLRAAFHRHSLATYLEAEASPARDQRTPPSDSRGLARVRKKTASRQTATVARRKG